MSIDKSKYKDINRFKETLLETNRSFDFYVNWDRLDKLLENYLVEINALDSLVGISPEKYDETFKKIVRYLPSSINILIYLIALSNSEKESYMKGRSNLKVVNSTKKMTKNIRDIEDLIEYRFNFNENDILDDKDIEKYLDFTYKTGIQALFTEYLDKCLFDYIKGCEVGLDSNARKNRGGKAFEIALEPIIRDICFKYGVKVITQSKINVLNEYGFNIDSSIGERRADFILYKNGKAANIEVNFYSDKGSKPQEIIDAYITRQEQLNDLGIEFILITDGQVWNTKPDSLGQIENGFKNIKYISNYNIMRKGYLEEIIINIF